jgi:hypothetical protein
VYSNVDYKITTHVLTASARLTGSITSKAGAKQDIARDLVQTATDEAHDAQSLANIPENPLDLPPRETLEAQLREAAFNELTASIGLAFAAYHQSLLDAAKQAADDDDRADKLVRFIVVDSAASDPAIDETLWKLRGIPDASARLRRLAGGK